MNDRDTLGHARRPQLFALCNLLVWAIFSIDPWHFFGLRQVFSPTAPEPPFSMRGPYRHVRHPIQAGLIIALWATPPMTAGHALLAGTLTLYSIGATLFLEELDLLDAIGPAYRAYRRHVPALLPFSLVRRRRWQTASMRIVTGAQACGEAERGGNANIS